MKGPWRAASAVLALALASSLSLLLPHQAAALTPLEHFEQWFRQHGGELHSSLTFQPASGGYRVVSHGTVKKEEKVISVPSKLLLTPYEGSPGVSLSEEERLVVKLGLELSKGRDSFWYPYLQVLPKPPLSTALYFTADDMQRLKGSYAATLIADIRKTFQGFLSKLRRIPATASIRRQTGLWRWCTSIVHSRAFTVDKGRQSVHALNARPFLAPGADILNHNPDIEVGWRLDASFDIHTLQPNGIQPGDEVFNNYQQFGNARLLSNYGFVVKHNPHNSLPLAITLPHRLLWEDRPEPLQQWSSLLPLEPHPAAPQVPPVSAAPSPQAFLLWLLNADGHDELRTSDATEEPDIIGGVRLLNMARILNMDERTADRAIAKLSISDCCNWRLRAVTTAEVTPEGATVLDAEEEEGTMDEWCAWLTHPDTFHLPVPQHVEALALRVARQVLTSLQATYGQSLAEETVTRSQWEATLSALERAVHIESDEKQSLPEEEDQSLEEEEEGEEEDEGVLADAGEEVEAGHDAEDIEALDGHTRTYSKRRNRESDGGRRRRKRQNGGNGGSSKKAMWVQRWLAGSPPHRQNLVTAWKTYGISLVREEEQVILNAMLNWLDSQRASLEPSEVDAGHE